MTAAELPHIPAEAGIQPPAPASPRPIAQRFARPPVDDGAGAVEDETHAGSVALLAAWG